MGLFRSGTQPQNDAGVSSAFRELPVFPAVRTAPTGSQTESCARGENTAPADCSLQSPS